MTRQPLYKLQRAAMAGDENAVLMLAARYAEDARSCTNTRYSDSYQRRLVRAWLKGWDEPSALRSLSGYNWQRPIETAFRAGQRERRELDSEPTPTGATP